jgi:CRP/FNR family cyclic AMP-dependent transcriptional regulator
MAPGGMNNMSNYAAYILRKAGVSEPVARSAAPKLTLQHHEAQGVVWAKGGEVQAWQFIITGLVAAAAPVQDARPVPITVYGPGSWFGEQPILNRMPPHLEYVCLVPTQVLNMPAVVLWELFDTEPDFARYIAKLAAWRAQKMAEMLVLVKLGNPCLRVVMGIAQFAEALASGRDLSVTEGLDGGISIPVTQTVLAAMCGVSRAVFSEYVQPLASNGWLTISYGQIELLSIATWHRFYKSRRAQSTTLISPTIEELLAELHRASVV